jgi:hypothetical protein
MKMTTHLHLIPQLTVSGDTHLLLLYTFMECTGTLTLQCTTVYYQKTNTVYMCMCLFSYIRRANDKETHCCKAMSSPEM